MHGSLDSCHTLIEKVCPGCEPKRENEQDISIRACSMHYCEPCAGTGTMNGDDGSGPIEQCDACDGSGVNDAYKTLL